VNLGISVDDLGGGFYAFGFSPLQHSVINGQRALFAGDNAAQIIPWATGFPTLITIPVTFELASTSVPEPSTYAMALCGIGVCLIARYRRTRCGSCSQCSR
jgi:hypothetical protein